MREAPKSRLRALVVGSGSPMIGLLEARHCRLIVRNQWLSNILAGLIVGMTLPLGAGVAGERARTE